MAVRIIMSRLAVLAYLSIFAVLFSVNIVDARIVLPNLSGAAWKSHDARVKTLLTPIHADLSRDFISPSVAAKNFSDVLSEFLSSESDFSTGNGGGGGGRRRQRVDISDEALKRAKEEKKRLRRLVVGRRDVSAEIRREFYESIRTHNSIKRLRDRSQRQSDAAAQERTLLKDFWAFSKKAVNGRVGKEEEQVSFS